MEIELKYNIQDSDTADRIWANELFKNAEEKDSREEKHFDARYFDTDGCDLAKNEIAYRVRREGEKLVAAVKWKGHSEDGLHVREEISVPVSSEDPEPEVFRESRIGCSMMEFIGDKELHCFLETTVLRRRFRIDTGTGLFEFSIDEGEIVTQYGRLPVSEVEIELFSGETEELLKIGKLLQDKYGLTEGNESKYYRGIKLIRENM